MQKIDLVWDAVGFIMVTVIICNSWLIIEYSILIYIYIGIYYLIIVILHTDPARTLPKKRHCCSSVPRDLAALCDNAAGRRRMDASANRWENKLEMTGIYWNDPRNPLPSSMNVLIGSMYAIYGNIYHQYTPNVSIYTILVHGSYGVYYVCVQFTGLITAVYAKDWIPFLVDLKRLSHFALSTKRGK
jgi:hypothetical protein